MPFAALSPDDFGTWCEASGQQELAALGSLDALPYCNNPDYSYYYSAAFSDGSPVCELDDTYELVLKQSGRAAFTTTYIEMHESGWPCAAADAAARAAGHALPSLLRKQLASAAAPAL